ncbi:MAG TPA: hypothetical protein PL143_16195 [Rhodocyclaceae bacterium]|nr:hypothetical protein [Rhodocyclaceae bacterium]
MIASVRLALHWIFALSVLAGIAAGPAWPAQDGAAGAVPAQISMETLEAGKRDIEADTSLAEDQRKRLLELYEQTMLRLRELQAVRDQANALDQTLRDAPQRIERLQSQLAAPRPPALPDPEALAAATLEEVEQWIAERERELEQARESLKRFEDELARLLAGTVSLNDDIAARTGAVEEIERQRRHEDTRLPADFDYAGLPGLSAELQAKLAQVRPETIGQAQRIPGMTPAAISLLLVALARRKGQRVA